MKPSELFEHNFIIKLRDENEKLKIKIVGIGNGNIGPDPNYVETAQRKYVFDVLSRASKILDTFEQLVYIPTFIMQFPNIDIYSKKGITHPDYLRYHIENHFLKMSTIFDLSIILVNEVFRIGTPARETSIRQLNKNYHTKSTDAVKFLNKFDKNIQNIKAIRNSITHRGEFLDPEFNLINNMQYPYKDLDDDRITLDPIKTESLEEMKQLLSPVVKIKIDEYVDSQSKLLIKNNEDMANTIIEIFESLEFEFNQRFINLE